MGVLKEIAKKSGVMGIFSLVSTALGLITFFLVTNILGPLQYGLLSICMSIYETLSIPHNSINNALVKYIAEKKQIKYLKGSLKINMFLAICFALLLFSFADGIAALLHAPIESLIRLTSIFLFVSIIKETISNAILGTSEVKWYIWNELVFAAIKLALVLLIILKIKNAFGILIAYTVAAILSIVLGLVVIKKIRFSEDKVEMKHLTTYAKKFSYTLLMSNIQPQIYILSLAFFASSLEVGYYKFLLSMITLVTVSIISMMSTVLQNYYSALHYEKKIEDIRNIFNISFRMGMYLLVVIGISFLIVVPFAIPLLFKKYIAVIPLIPLFVLFGIISGANFLVNPLIKATNKLEIQLKALPISLLFAVLMSFLLIPKWKATGAILAATGSALILLLLSVMMLIKELKIKLDIFPQKDDLRMIVKIMQRTKVKIKNYFV